VGVCKLSSQIACLFLIASGRLNQHPPTKKLPQCSIIVLQSTSLATITIVTSTEKCFHSQRIALFDELMNILKFLSTLSTQLNSTRRKFVCEHVRHNARRKCLSNVYHIECRRGEIFFPATMYRLKLKNDTHLIDFVE
jgi:hypothetical protein